MSVSDVLEKKEKMNILDLPAGNVFWDITGVKWLRGRKDGYLVHAECETGKRDTFATVATVWVDKELL